MHNFWHNNRGLIGYILLGSLLSLVLAFAIVDFRPLYIFASIVVVLVVGLIIKHPQRGMYLLAFALPFERIGSVELANITVRPSQVLAIITVLAWVARSFALNKFTLRANPLFIPTLLFISINFIGLLNTPNLSRSLLVLGFTVFTMMIALILPNIINQSQQIRLVIIAILISCSLVSVFGIYQFLGDLMGLPIGLTGLRLQYTKAILGFPRIQSTALEPLYFANYLLIPLGAALSLLFSKVRVMKPVWLVLLSALASLNLFLTVSRGGYIAFAVMIALLAIIYHKTLLRLQTLLSIIMATALIGFISVRFINVTRQWDTFVSHVENIFGGASYFERIETFTLAQRIWLEHPWFGIGPGGFGPYASYHPLLQPIDGYKIVNNEYVELLAETGIMGLTIFIIIIAVLLLRSWKALRCGSDLFLRALLIGLNLALVAILVQYNTFSILYIMHIWFLFGLMIAVQNGLLYEAQVK